VQLTQRCIRPTSAYKVIDHSDAGRCVVQRLPRDDLRRDQPRIRRPAVTGTADSVITPPAAPRLGRLVDGRDREGELGTALVQNAQRPLATEVHPGLIGSPPHQ
jgi:hypothetical protein